MDIPKNFKLSVEIYHVTHSVTTVQGQDVKGQGHKVTYHIQNQQKVNINIVNDI